MASGFLGLIGQDSIHIIEHSDWKFHFSFCGTRFKKKKFNTISFDDALDEMFCEHCLFFSGQTQKDKVYETAHRIIPRFLEELNKDKTKVIKLFSFKLGKFQRWVKRTAGHRPILRGKK